MSAASEHWLPLTSLWVTILMPSLQGHGRCNQHLTFMAPVQSHERRRTLMLDRDVFCGLAVVYVFSTNATITRAHRLMSKLLFQVAQQGTPPEGDDQHAAPLQRLHQIKHPNRRALAQPEHHNVGVNLVTQPPRSKDTPSMPDRLQAEKPATAEALQGHESGRRHGPM